MVNTNRITSELISSLGENEIFVFGSNVQGEHVGGAALFAVLKFGAENGKGEGLQGHCYAIPSCERISYFIGNRFDVKTTRPFAHVIEMSPYIERFISFAREHADLHFLVTKIGCGIAGMDIKEVADAFKGCIDLENVSLPIEFWEHYGLI